MSLSTHPEYFFYLSICADLFTPILAIANAWALFRSYRRKHKLVFRATSMTFISTLIITYSIYAIDWFFNVWATMSLDYSTHSALALALICTLRGKLLYWCCSFILYGALMITLSYHSAIDIISTSAIVLPAFLATRHLIFQFHQLPALRPSRLFL